MKQKHNIINSIFALLVIEDKFIENIIEIYIIEMNIDFDFERL